MNPTQEQLNARIRDSISPPTPVTVDASRLSGGSSLNFPQTPKLDQPLSLANFSINDAITANNQTTQAETDRKGGLSRIAELTKSLFNKPADTQTLEQNAGLPDMTKQLTEANNQFRLTSAEQNQLIQEAGIIPLQMQEKFKGTGATTGGVAPIQSGALRENAIKQYMVTSKGLFQQAIISNLRDDIAGAEKAVEKAIQYKYAPQEQEIAYLKDWLQYNAQDLTREEKKKADNLNMVLEERTRLLDIAKEDDKITQGFIAEAIKTSQNNGKPVPQLLLQRASEAKTPNEALQILAPYMVDADAKASALLDRQYKQAQIAKMNADIALTNEQKNKIIAETTGNPETAKAQLQSNEALALAKELIKPTAIGKKEAIGASPSKFFSGLTFGGLQALGLQPDRTAYEAKVDTLKSNLTLDNLKLLKGAMSDKDLLFLNSIGSSLNTGMSEKEFDKELQRVIDKLETAGAVAGTVRMTSPEGVAYDVPSAQVELFKQNGYK